MPRMSKATKALFQTVMPTSKKVVVQFKCPMCGGTHSRSVEVYFEYRGNDGYGFSSSTMDWVLTICDDCMFSKDPAVEQKYHQVCKEFRHKYNFAQYGIRPKETTA